MKTESEILLEARELIAKPEHWTQGHAAKDETGVDVIPYDKNACSFCLYGAVVRAAYANNTSADSILQAVHSRLQWQSIGSFNDTHTHAEVLTLMEQAAEDLEEAGR